MMAPAAFRRHREREPPFFFLFLDLPPRWEKGFPSGPWSPWRQRGESPSEIGSLSLFPSVSVLPDSALSPFLKFPEIYNSDWAEILTRFLSRYWLSCSERRAPTALQGVHEGQGRAPCLVAPSGTISHGFFFPKIIYIPKKISVSFYPVWTPFDMDFLRNKIHATNRNWHWALDQYVSPKNSIKSCQNYVKVVEYWHGTIKNYRYDGDVSASPSLIPARPRVGK